MPFQSSTDGLERACSPQKPFLGADKLLYVIVAHRLICQFLTRQRTYKITLQEPGGRGGDDDNRKRYNVSLKPAQKLDMDNITKYCRGEKQSQLDKDRAVSPTLIDWCLRSSLAKRHSSHQCLVEAVSLRKELLSNTKWTQILGFW
jgi:hypothetical protein